MPWVLRSFWTGSEGWAPLLIQYRMRSSLSTIVDGSVCGLYRPSVSMNLPSLGDRRSATTTRHWGSFFPPTRGSRMLTAISAEQDSERHVRSVDRGGAEGKYRLIFVASVARDRASCPAGSRASACASARTA